MYNLKLISFTFLVLALTACKKKPVACFVLPTGTIEIEEQVNIKNCSENATGYKFEIPALDTGIEVSSFSVRFPYEGLHKVKLVAKNDDGEDILERHIKVVKIDLTDLVSGSFNGTFTETYPDSVELNRTYQATVNVAPLDHKNIKVSFPRGTFEVKPVGTNDAFTFSKVDNLFPTRIQSMTQNSGSYKSSTQLFTFTLSGTDPNTGDLRWQIRFTGRR